MKSGILTALTVASLIAFAASPTLAWDSSASWKPSFLSEEQMIAAEGAREVDYLTKEYGLKSGFSATEYGAAVAETEIQRLRKERSLGTNFTSEELAANYGAVRVSELMNLYSLPTRFTSAQLRKAKAAANVGWLYKPREGLSYPFSAADYQRAAGVEEVERYARDYRLPNAWVYSDLVSGAGPRSASEIRHTMGFAKDATHDQISMALGKSRAKSFALSNGLPQEFSAADLEMLGAKNSLTYSEYAELQEPFSDEDMVAFFGRRALEYISKRYGLSAPFSEPQLRAAISADAIAKMQERYDLDANFGEADVKLAAGRSASASTRRNYNLRPGFSAAEYELAYKKSSDSLSNWQRYGY